MCNTEIYIVCTYKSHITLILTKVLLIYRGALNLVMYVVYLI